jgi:hypothetical protein
MNQLLQLGFVLLSIAACANYAPQVTTQPQRQQYLAAKINESLTGQMNCPNAKLTFMSTETTADVAGPTYDDFYVAEGCGQRTGFLTSVRMVGDSGTTMTTASPVPPVEQYRSEAHAQLAKTAEFELGCTDISYVDLNENVPPLRNTYETSIGASGCGKKTMYHTRCNETGYSAGAHAIQCKSAQDVTSDVN